LSPTNFPLGRRAILPRSHVVYLRPIGGNDYADQRGYSGFRFLHDSLELLPRRHQLQFSLEHRVAR
jgi:hypothetical protein